MFDLCPRCRRGFVQCEPYVRVETLRRGQHDRTVHAAAIDSALFHLSCAPWGDPKYRITRPERTPIRSGSGGPGDPASPSDAGVWD